MTQIGFRKRLRRELMHSDSVRECPPCKRLKKCTNPNLTLKKNDPFSRLSDDIIVSHILSRLSLEEVVRSSVLSRRWHKLWTESIGPELIFSYTRDCYLCPIYFSRSTVLKLTPILARGVSHILETYCKPTLDGLTVRFDFDTSSQDDICSWVEYAFRKGINRLELDFSQWLPYPKDNYTFPSVAKLSALHACCDDNLHQSVKCSGMYNLRDVCLKDVNISSEVIELLLSNCPLERLCVWRSMLKTKVRVTGRSVKLKSLEFVWCLDTKIKISSPNLISLHYSGSSKALSLKQVPLLSELSIGRNYCKKFLRKDLQVFGYVSQLKRLTLDIGFEVDESIKCALEFPQLVKLEQLEIKMRSCLDMCEPWPIVLIKAAPVLQKFSMQVHLYCMMVNSETSQQGEMVTKLPNAIKQVKLPNAIKQVKHQCLKCIVLGGFRGCCSEMELARHLLGISESLEQLVIAPFVPNSPGPLSYTLSQVEQARKLAQKLTSWLPPAAQLVVL